MNFKLTASKRTLQSVISPYIMLVQMSGIRSHGIKEKSKLFGRWDHGDCRRDWRQTTRIIRWTKYWVDKQSQTGNLGVCRHCSEWGGATKQKCGWSDMPGMPKVSQMDQHIVAIIGECAHTGAHPLACTDGDSEYFEKGQFLLFIFFAF